MEQIKSDSLTNQRLFTENHDIEVSLVRISRFKIIYMVHITVFGHYMIVFMRNRLKYKSLFIDNLDIESDIA